MTDRDRTPEELAAILDRLASEEGRRLTADDPELRNLAREYREFLDSPALPPEADVPAASRRLRRRLDALTPLAARRERPAAWRRPLVAVAAVLVVAVGLYAVRTDLLQPTPSDLPGHGAPTRDVLRGEPAASPRLWVESSNGGLALRWTAPAGANAAVVMLYDAALAPVRRLPAGDGERFALAPSALAGARFVQVVFLQAGDRIGETTLEPLP